MEDENSWVFDSLVAFLNGPIWNAPLQSFIEEKSLIFEPNVTDNEDYKSIYDEFKNLVDFMLGNFMEDIGITSEQFENACSVGRKYVNFNSTLFEQIWAANDYEMFKRMMTQRNVELQIQALELIERKYGITPESFIPNKKGTNIQEIPVIIENSKLEKAIMEEVAKNFPDDEEASTSTDEKYIMEEKEILQQTLKETKDKSKPPISEITTSISPIEKSLSTIAEKRVIFEKSPVVDTSYDKQPKNTEIDATELKKRQEYLRSQRDKLVALKKEARKKQLTDTNLEKSKARPKSAKAAESVLIGQQIEPQKLKFRKTLAERLRSEVVKNAKE